jgi:rare lipoprotein A
MKKRQLYKKSFSPECGPVKSTPCRPHNVGGDVLQSLTLICEADRKISIKKFLYSSFLLVFLSACTVVSTTYDVTKGTVKATYKVAETATRMTIGTGKFIFKAGQFTYEVVMAPMDWPLTSDIDTIDGLSPKEAIRLGKVKDSPYTVRGVRYIPMSIEESKTYQEKGVASWYGYETYRRKGGRMTANGEAFDPDKPSAAHKLLPLPAVVKVTNLDNGRSMLVRVNDRGPFVKGRIIDLSAGAAKKLGFYRAGIANVKIETVEM